MSCRRREFCLVLTVVVYVVGLFVVGGTGSYVFVTKRRTVGISIALLPLFPVLYTFGDTAKVEFYSVLVEFYSG